MNLLRNIRKFPILKRLQNMLHKHTVFCLSVFKTWMNHFPPPSNVPKTRCTFIYSYSFSRQQEWVSCWIKCISNQPKQCISLPNQWEQLRFLHLTIPHTMASFLVLRWGFLNSVNIMVHLEGLVRVSMCLSSRLKREDCEIDVTWQWAGDCLSCKAACIIYF